LRLLVIIPSVCAATLILSACGSSDAGDEQPAPLQPQGGSGVVTGSDAQVGFFDIKLVAPVPAIAENSATAGFSSVLGKVYDGPVPEALVWTERQRDGDCRLLVPSVPFCGGGCGGSEVCVADDKCLAQPTALDAGSITVRGVRTEAGATEFTLTPVRNTYVNAGDIKLPYPPFQEGAAVELIAAGARVSPFQIMGKGIVPLELPLDAAYQLAADQPLALSWQAPGIAGVSRVSVKLDISHHGGTKGKIECEAEDNGTLVIPAAMTTELLALGIAGFPTVAVTRSSVASTSIPEGRVDLQIYSYVERRIEIDGLMSCTEDSQCQGGLTCGSDKRCK
jgi:hypothetical protein